MKECPKCKTNKSLDNFANNKSRKDGLQRTCRECVKVKDKEWFQNNRQKYYNNNKIYYDYRNDFINRYKSIFGKCVDCGNEDPRVLDFDHLKEKTMNVSEMKRHSLGKIKEEIRKCEVRCSNCHRIKTHERRLLL
tara:strand:+ start:123 stop:527 length:405 start_codon:yes stop_codon:yes gene_type:complete